MNFTDLDIKLSYISCGEENIAKSFLVPTLKQAKLYQRSVGFFSSSVLAPIIDGIVTMARKDGKIQLVASPQLSEQDVKAINLGYEQREEIINTAFTRDFIAAIEDLDDDRLKLLVSLIANDTLDIKIAVTNSAGMYHDKLGILEDFDGNVIAFFGSANSSINGYQDNYEKIRVVKSWIAPEQASIADERREFDALWNDTNPYVKVYSYKESARKHIQSIKRVLSAHGFKSSQFTAKENMADRMELVDAFNKGEISALAAIRCLDEGINIPSIKSALILSSNDDYREFVQRRGRILRTYEGKKFAKIYDVIVLPSRDLQGWAKIEFRRFYEYAKLALNWNKLEPELESYLTRYDLCIEDIDVYDYEDVEDTVDE